jgi:hypothetical protein
MRRENVIYFIEIILQQERSEYRIVNKRGLENGH